MADFDVTLHYLPNPDPNGKPLFHPDPNPIKVKRNQTISFKKSSTSVPGTIKVTFHNPGLFSPLSTDGSTVVTVTGDPVVTTYHCALLDDQGHPIAESASGAGGDIIPGEVG